MNLFKNTQSIVARAAAGDVSVAKQAACEVSAQQQLSHWDIAEAIFRHIPAGPLPVAFGKRGDPLKLGLVGPAATSRSSGARSARCCWPTRR